MNLKEALLFAYGLIFATSTPYLKPKNRFLFPTATWKFDSELTFFLGGSGICAHLRGSTPFMVNSNLGVAAEQWRADLASVGGFANATLAMSSIGGFFGSEETLAALKPAKVFAHADDVEALSSWVGLPVENLSTEHLIQVGDEVVHLIPVSGCATESDLVVFFEKRSVMMFGSLFNNKIHPVLKHGVSSRTGRWIETLEMLLTKYNPSMCVPGEGEMGDADSVREFMRYLTALTDPTVEFSFCRKNFDWMEIPSATSLEENFDILRLNVKTHTSMN